MGFHVLQTVRQRYEFEQPLLNNNGKAAISTFYHARQVADKINRRRDLIAHPEQAVFAGQVNGVALIQGITHYLFRSYRAERNPQLLPLANAWLRERLGKASTDQVIGRFITEFPPLSVAAGEQTPAEYLAATVDGLSNRDLVLEELLLLWLSNANPAFRPVQELFGDDQLEQETAYQQFMADFYQFFNSQAAREPLDDGGTFDADQNIIDLLLAPLRTAPDSLEAQLQFLMKQWGTLIDDYLVALLRSLDLIHEENRPGFVGGGGDGQGGSFFHIASSADYAAAMETESENFTPDREWMPNLVMIAKNSYVWLDQLSRKYGRSISRLDQIPDAELDLFASWGITGLWLIGLWERSTASERIKRMMGNSEAVASAYSLRDYRIADKLGGEAACNDLKQRAWKRGIRLASDMVPNHVGIDGTWVIDHPDWFMSLPYSPFPTYTFNGPDLSYDERVGLFLEDHYYDRSDAAVVFKRVDRWTGDVRYIYHGNDGTALPWNDTAQLDYLKHDLREAMIQLILHIARQFPIIRFDAAMTLVKRHVARLWFPEPGTGGAIASRAEHGMTRAQFDALMPQEFWREVVDRAAVEAPDTLLLAEAFWMMENYFVRTLGMHRVYNSAFMVLLRDEDNVRYRGLMKNTLEFDPEVLRRFVNFMNNPDERTAVDQFGKDDKYFGVATLMMTMPGLPMLGHGQIEGFTEKYGMEYQRAYFDEQADPWLLSRHEREIFPLARQRYLFAGVEHFLLYDFFTADGQVNEDVFAYSNRYHDQYSLVVYHNKFAEAHGWVKTSVEYSIKVNEGGERAMRRRTLSEGLGLAADPQQFVIFRDQRANLDYIRSCKQICEEGLYIELGGYRCNVFLGFRVVTDGAAGLYANLNAHLNGRGVPNINEAIQELAAEPVRQPYAALVNGDRLRSLLDARDTAKPVSETTLHDFETQLTALLTAVQAFTAPPAIAAVDEDENAPPASTGKTAKAAARKSAKTAAESAATVITAEPVAIAAVVRAQLARALTPAAGKDADDPAIISPAVSDDRALWVGVLIWLASYSIGQASSAVNAGQQSRSWYDEWLFGKIAANTLRELGFDAETVERTDAAIRLWISQQAQITPKMTAEALLDTLLADTSTAQYLRINRFDGVLWYNKEAFETLLTWIGALSQVMIGDTDGWRTVLSTLRQWNKQADYRVERLRNPTAAPVPGTAVRKPSAAKKIGDKTD